MAQYKISYFHKSPPPLQKFGCLIAAPSLEEAEAARQRLIDRIMANEFANVPAEWFADRADADEKMLLWQRVPDDGPDRPSAIDESSVGLVRVA